MRWLRVERVEGVRVVVRASKICGIIVWGRIRSSKGLNLRLSVILSFNRLNKEEGLVKDSALKHI